MTEYKLEIETGEGGNSSIAIFEKESCKAVEWNEIPTADQCNIAGVLFNFSNCLKSWIRKENNE